MVDVVRDPDTVLFVGSGISTWSLLPTWPRLIGGLIDYCEERGRPTRLARSAFAAGDLLDAADKLSDSITQAEIGVVIRERQKFAAARPSRIHDLITRLGPQRYVSTNYDNLIEQQLGLTGRSAAFRTVTNRQVSELADIQKASADNFIFKPHGDMNDAETLVLSRSHYNSVLAGQNNSVLRVLETLMVTRPVLFLGYGLKDPDTLLVLQTLQARHNKGVGDFWAILADADEEERGYWRRQYNIDVVAYQTRDGEGAARHAALADLLEEIVRAPAPTAPHATLDRLQTTYQLMRYAARWAYTGPAHIIAVTADSYPYWLNEAEQLPHHGEISDLMMAVPRNMIVQGSAGAGKTFAVARFMSKLARDLLDWCSSDQPVASTAPAIPVLLNVRGYAGDLKAVVDNFLPAGLDLLGLAKSHEITFLVDGIDEIPAEHLESGTWQGEFERMCAPYARTKTIFFTRRAEMLRERDAVTLYINPLSDETIDANLHEVGASASPLLRQSLRTPFVLSLARRYLPRQPSISSAPLLIESFVEECAEQAFGVAIASHLTELENIAVEVLNSGKENIDRTFAADRVGGAHALDQLVASGLFASEVEGAVRFHHRIITEYLASGWFTGAWERKETRVRDVLNSNRWDDAVVWCTARLPQGERQRFFTEVMAVDPVLGIRVAENAEMESEALWRLALGELRQLKPDITFGHAVNSRLENSRVPPGAKPELLTLAMSLSQAATGAALAYLATSDAVDVHDWINLSAADRYNFWTRVGPVLGGRLDKATLAQVLERWASDVESEANDNVHVAHKYSSILSGIADPLVADVITWADSNAAISDAIAPEALCTRKGAAVDAFFARAIARGSQAAIFQLYLRLPSFLEEHVENDKELFAAPPVSDALLDALLAAARRTSDASSRWTFALLARLITLAPSWGEAIATKAASQDADEALALRMLMPEAQDERNAFWAACLKEPINLETDLRYFAFRAYERAPRVSEEDVLPILARAPVTQLNF
ncbi:MAG: SIR2 family protein [Hyphomonadaceae bacterium JAD_PAG50586_4]|nr:MAG: SIR2 family protein [Hyphomonadaceae bacterium JAD_PAG50586_4]